MRGGIFFAVAAVLALGGAATLFWPTGKQATEGPAGLSPVDLAAGQAIYAEQCASCHGANLEGAPDWRSPGSDGTYPAPPHDETGHTWHHDDALLFDYTKLGGDAAMAARGVANANSGMPAFADVLTDAEIRDVIAWIKSTWPEPVRAAQAARSEG